MPTFPGQAPRSLGLMLAVAARARSLLGGLVQINPIWLWGPYHVGSATNGAQPDWYLGWLIGALRLVPGLRRRRSASYTLVPNPFWGGALFPLVVFGVLGLWPWLERRLDRRPRLPQPARPAARRARADRDRRGVPHLGLPRLLRRLGRPASSSCRARATTSQIWVYRVLIWVLPVLVFFVTRRFCRELLAHERIELDHERAEDVARAIAEERERRAAEEPA